jgi:hypothetical protein
MSAAERGDRFKLHPLRRTEQVVMASEIQRPPKLEDYLCMAGLYRAGVKVRSSLLHRRQIEFIARALPRLVGDSGPNSKLASLMIDRGLTSPHGTVGTPVRIQD